MSSRNIDDVLAGIERRMYARRLITVVTLVLVAVLTYFSIGFLGGRAVPEILAAAQFDFFFTESQKFADPNFVDFTAYSRDNGITGGIDPLVASFSNPSTFYTTVTSVSSSLLVSAAAITLVIGIVGTVLGFPFALIFGVLGSERVVPFPFNFIFRGTMSTIRAVPALVWVFIYAALIPLSPLTATIAIATDTIGNLGRLFTDELEEIEEGPIEAIRSTGASQSQVVNFGMLSQVSTSFIAWTLYILEINTRIAVSLGVVGAGGLGQYLQQRLGFFEFHRAGAGLLVLLFLILSVELLSSRVRARLRPGEHESKGFLDSLRDLGDGGKWLGYGGDSKN